MSFLTKLSNSNFRTSRHLKITAATLLIGALLVTNLWLILTPPMNATTPLSGESAPPSPQREERSPSPEAVRQSDFQAIVPLAEEDHLPDYVVKPSPRPVTAPSKSSTVKQAAANSCSTSSVAGLSKQIIAQSRCIDPNAFVRVPERPNLVKRAGVFLYMAAPARDRLLSALDANRKKTLVVTSALRTVAQQYLLSSWGSNHRCGIELAALPGKSNHESGLALDISHPETFRSALEAHGFAWLGAKDRVHFDYRGKGAVARNAIDVMAFQQLWNKNHPEDRISENGRYTSQTERRLMKSPASGFALNPQCK